MARRVANAHWEAAAKLVAEGRTQAEIADQLGLNPHTVGRWKKNPHYLKLVDAALAGKTREVRGLKAKTDAEAVEQRASDSEWDRLVKDADILKLKLRAPQQRIVDAFDAGYKVAIFGGGNGGGKTILAVREALETCWGLKQWAPKLATVKIIGEDWKQMAGVFREYITLYVPPEMVATWGAKEHGLPTAITFKNGSTLSFGTNKQGPMAHQGQRCNLIIYDEQPEYDVYEEGSARMSREGKAPRQLFTMTPTRGKGWVWDELIQNRVERKVIYETCAIFENGEGVCVACDTSRPQWDAILRTLHLKRDPAEAPIQGGRWLNLQLQATDDETVSRAEGFCHRCWTFGLQPFAEPDFVKLQISNNRSNSKRVAMRLLGSWENLDGSALFDQDQMEALKAHCREPRTTDHTSLQVWEVPRPRCPYVIGADPARGTGGDETVFQVINAATGVQAAVWGNNDIKWTEYIDDLVGLSQRYWKATVIVELNKGEGLAYALERDHPKVPQYRTPRRDRHGVVTVSNEVGFQMTPDKRKRVLANMVRQISNALVQRGDKYIVEPNRRDAVYITDAETIRQLGRMFYDEDGRIDIPKGRNSHDDRVMALALALEARNHPHQKDAAPKTNQAEHNNLMRKYLNQQARQAESAGRSPWDRRS